MFTRFEKVVIGILIAAILAAAVSFLIGDPAEAHELPVVTLIQQEPVYVEPTEIVGVENTYNPEKFSNPVTCSGDDDTFKSGAYQHTSVVSDVPATGDRLTRSKGVHQGPSGVETYYNLDMSGCIEIMRGLGFSEEEYPYWIREDGAKMLGEYVMIAAKLDIRPKGTIVETSLGLGIVSDTAAKVTYQRRGDTHIDIATNWR